MKRLPLSAKVALWSCLLAAITMGISVYVTEYVLETELMSFVEQRMERMAKDIFYELDHRPEGTPEKLTKITRDMLPRSAASSVMEIFGPGDKLLYRAPSLKDRTLREESGGARRIVVSKQNFWTVPYQQRGLTLMLAYPLKQNEVTMERVRAASLVALPVAVVLSLLGGYWLAGRALKPVRKISEAAARITAEDLHQRLPVPPARDDIRRLTNVLNETFERLERSYLQAVRFASDASHQLKTPVTVMRAAIEALLADATLRPAQAAVLNDLLDQTRRLSSLTEGLLLLARADAGGIATQAGDVDLVPILERCIEDAEVLGSNQDIRIEHELPASLRAFADPQRTEQILLNLLENAVKYNRHGGLIRVTADERRDGIFVTVSNSGVPIPPDRMPWIFDRFARGGRDESRAGHGLGLSIARELANAQGGDVRLVRSDSEATEFELRLAPAHSRREDTAKTPLLAPPERVEVLRIPG